MINTMHKPILKYLLIFVLGFSLLAGLSSCSKDADEPVVEEELPDEETADPALFNRLIRVDNVKATQENNTSGGVSPVYFSLETKAVKSEEHRRTRNWDLAFSGMFNSFLSGNNGTNSSNLAAGGAGTGGILIIEKPFEEVLDVPSDTEFKTAGDLIGTDNYGDFGEGTGWYLYDYEGTIVRAGATQDQHVAYALSAALRLQNGTEVKPRTIVLRTAKGNYAKIKMLSCYKDQLDPALWKKDGEKMYFTFDYILVPAGSKTFSTR